MQQRSAFLGGGSIAVLILALLAVGCTASEGAAANHSFAGPLQGTADAIGLERYATRSAVEVSAAEVAAQATAQAAVFKATHVALQQELARENQWATQQADRATHTAQAAAAAVEATRAETSYRATSTADAQSSAATATVEAERWQATRQALESTRVAEATTGALALQGTVVGATRQANHTATAEAVAAAQMAHQATATRAAEQREVTLGYARDYGIPLGLVLFLTGLAGLAVFFIRQMAKRPQIIPRDDLGDAPLIRISSPDGSERYLDLDRQPGALVEVLADGRVSAPQLRDPGQEERTTARDQVGDAMTRPRLGGGHRAARPSALPMTPLPPPPSAPGLRKVAVFRTLGQASKAGMLPPPLAQAVEADWEEVEE